MRKQKQDSNIKMKALWLELISTIILFIVMVVVIVISSIYMSKIDNQVEPTASIYCFQILDYGG